VIARPYAVAREKESRWKASHPWMGRVSFHHMLSRLSSVTVENSWAPELSNRFGGRQHCIPDDEEVVGGLKLIALPEIEST